MPGLSGSDHNRGTGIEAVRGQRTSAVSNLAIAGLREPIAANKGRNSGVSRVPPRTNLTMSASRLAADSPRAELRVKTRDRVKPRARTRRDRSRNRREDRPANVRRTPVSAGAGRGQSAARVATYRPIAAVRLRQQPPAQGMSARQS